jgi:hypothetical protein
MKQFIFFLTTLFIFFSAKSIFSQTFCGTESFSGENDNPDSFRGGFYKPATSNIGGAPNNLGYFPVLVVFVQFKNESGDSTTTNFDSWPARKKPNYFDSVISKVRLSSTNWWDTYNGFAISDYWHEFSRGKLHVYGNKLSIILPHEIDYFKRCVCSKKFAIQI